MIKHRTVTIDGLKIFYREAGDAGKPAIVLLHGFPTSSHMYRHLIPALADQFHVIAPDYPGFGLSDAPSPSSFGYTFDGLADVIEKLLLKELGLERFGLFVQDYGGPVGFRIAIRHPERIDWLIVQNSNAYEEGSAGSGTISARSTGSLPPRRPRHRCATSSRPPRLGGSTRRGRATRSTSVPTTGSSTSPPWRGPRATGSSLTSSTTTARTSRGTRSGRRT
jgi:pimeloyl-ACP methyl ester carboxylesterase